MIFVRSDSTVDFAQAIPIVLVVVGVAIWIRIQLGRIREIEELAARHRFGTLDGSLPQGFPSQLLEPRSRWWGGLQAMAIENLVGGWEGEDFLLVFDLIEGSGKRRTKRTIIARKVTHPRTKLPSIGAGLTLRKIGDWYVVSGGGIFNRGLLKPATIEKAWAALADATKPGP